jgi:bacillithiol system protein YtxJ
MDWIQLTNDEQLEEISAKSIEKPQVIFKHSTRCSISTVAMKRLNKGSLPENIDFYHLDLLSYRNLSNKIAQKFGVNHESPQVLIIRNGQCVYDESHLGISLDDITEQALAPIME